MSGIEAHASAALSVRGITDAVNDQSRVAKSHFFMELS